MHKSVSRSPKLWSSGSGKDPQCDLEFSFLQVVTQRTSEPFLLETSKSTRTLGPRPWEMPEEKTCHRSSEWRGPLTLPLICQASPKMSQVLHPPLYQEAAHLPWNAAAGPGRRFNGRHLVVSARLRPDQANVSDRRVGDPVLCAV